MKPRFAAVNSALRKAAPALIVIALSSAVSQGANKYWDTTAVAGLLAGSGTWDVGTTSLWSTATAGTALTTFATGDDAFFQTAGTNTVTLGADLTAKSITQTTGSTATTINNGGGTQITVTTGNITNSGNTAFAINPDIVLGATGTINATAAITLGGIVSGSGFTKIGTNSLTLSNTNTYTGATTISAGTAILGGANGAITTTSGITVNNGGTLSYDNTGAAKADRLGAAQGVSLNGGTFNYKALSAGASTGQVGTLSLGAGLTSFLSSTSATSPQTSTMTIVGISTGAHTTFSASLANAEQAHGRVAVTTPLTLTNGIIPWAIETTNAAFLTQDSSNNIGAYAKVNSGGALGTYTAWKTDGTNTATDNVRVSTLAASPLTADNTVNAIQFNLAASSVDLGGKKLTVDSGGVLFGIAAGGTIGNAAGDGTLTSGSGNELYLMGSSTAAVGTVNAVIANNASPVAVTRGGAGTVTLNATNTYTGATTIGGGTLAVGATASIHASSAVTVNTGGVLNVNAGGTVNGTVTAEISTGQATANVINSGILADALAVNAGTGPASPNANATAVIATGHAQLNAGSSTGNITNNGQLTLSGSAPFTAIGTISGSGGKGGFNDANTDTKTLNLAAGSAFSYFRPTNTTGTATSILQVVGNGTTSFQWFGYNNTVTGSADVTFNGGTFNIGRIGQNNTGATTIGNYTVTNSSVLNIAAGGHEHGTWNIINGTMAFTGNIAQANGTAAAASALQLTVNNSGGGSGSTLLATGALTLGHGGGASSVQNNFLTIGNGGTASFTAGLLSVGTTQAATSETNTVNLNGGKLLVGGTTGIVAGTGTGQTKTFNWTGGRLAALQITPGVNFTNPVSGGITTTGLVNSGGVLAPGDVGTAGSTKITGDYTQQAGGTLAIDIGGTNQTGSFQQTVTPSYDNLLLNGTTANLSLNGTLQVSLVGFTPANGDTFTIIRSAPTALALSGAFSNVAFGARITTQGGEGSFLLSNTGTAVTLSDYQSAGGTTYDAWIAPFGVSDPSVGGDPDNDGLDNGVEHILGSDPSVSSTGLNQLSATATTLKFRHNQTNALASDVTKSYQWSTDLVEWKSSGQANTGGTTATIAEATITDNTAPANDVIEVTVTVSGTPASRVFGRLVATKVP